ncbi:MAG TPA: restriction endonuclease subunit S [Pseudomonas sp.]|uniref:restriction endonuclease subunit S n=1 Tax=Pseudomonas sp. TaxID=306 RepID=UPI002D199581|nr:restriction endonuclease subunit S [Pseudomonas sp.]HRL91924.1 restriction endonuclease subunit S [Pseudomonas sp.]
MSDALYEKRPLGEMVERHIGGGTPPRQVASYWKGKIPWASVKDFTEQNGVILETEEHISSAGLHASASNLIPAKTPLVCTRMAVGRAALPAVSMAINQDVKALFPAPGVPAEYLLKLMQFIQPLAEGRAVGSTVKGIRVQDYLGIPVPLAAQEAQPVIAKILDTLDTAICETEALIDKLKAVKQGLLHDLLTRGIDANGQLRPPQSEAPQLYKESPLGWAPEEWGQTSARELCLLITKGTTPTATNMWQGSGGIRFLRVDNLSLDGQFDFNASNFRISPRTHIGELARSICLPGDVLTNIVGPPLGKLGLVTAQNGEVNINQAIALFRPKPTLLSSFLLLWLGSSHAQTWLRKRAKQTSGQVNLTLALCQELPIPEVPLEEQQLIVSRFEEVHERLSIETDALNKLRRMKAGLTDDLLTGRVRVTPLLQGPSC